MAHWTARHSGERIEDALLTGHEVFSVEPPCREQVRKRALVKQLWGEIEFVEANGLDNKVFRLSKLR
jgi:hypothetical protein